MKRNLAKLLVVVFMLCLTVTPFSGVFAENNHISMNLTDVQTTVNYLKTGQLYLLPLDEIFTDSTSGHQLTYSVSGANLGPHTHIAYPEGVPTFVFTVANAGTYYATVRATCPTENVYAEFTITFNVSLATNGTPSQYDYTETDKSPVTVYVTISNDGMPIKNEDGVLMANLRVDLPHFYLNSYQLDSYNRYPTSGGNGGEYISSDPSDLILRPTALHLYLYLLENYYIDTPLVHDYDLLDYSFNSTKYVEYMDSNSAYTIGTSDKAISIGGSATSLYLTSFWGHDCNLMYFRNHVYPLMSPGWGATCDSALLNDGDVIEIAMFTDWEFFSNGAFLRFDGYEKMASCHVSPGNPLTVNVQRYDTSSVAMGGTESFEDTDGGIIVAIYESNGDYYDEFTWVNSTGNTYTYSLPQNMPTGTYYVVAMDENAETSDACMAPAVMTVDVY